MSTRKIIFIIIAWILLLAIIIGIFSLGNKKVEVSDVPKSITLWITEGSSEWYQWIIEGFKTYAPEYRNTEIIVEKKTSDPIRYRTLLLNTLTDWVGPDIFMLTSGEDRVLEGKREPIPSNILPISQIEDEYEDIFSSLLTWSTSSEDDSKEDWEKVLFWVPIWFETLGIFYNKALLREIPKTFDEVEKLYTINFWSWKYPTNLWLGPRYTPNASDIIWFFVWGEGNSYSDLSKGSETLSSYFNFRNLSIQSDVTVDTEDIYAPKSTILTSIESLEKDKKTTYDLFMQGDIAMILGYPSIINELEKSTKRSGIDSIENLVLTAPVPQDQLSSKKRNIVRFPYLSISKATKSPFGAAKFLEYLMTDDGIRKIQEAYPYLIPPKPSLYESWKWKSLSNVLTRARLDAFIPEIGETLSVFDFWLKAEFDVFLSEAIDRNENIDINNISKLLISTIDCGIGLYLGTDLSSECEKKE
jgi:ABC-type glycerol-3-phosphate transport system substrate-binding protein